RYEVGFQNLSQAAETAQRRDHFFERRAPVQRSGIHIAEHRQHHLGHVAEFNLLVVDLRRYFQCKVLRQHEIDLVAVHVAFLRLPQMPRNQRAQPAFAVVQRGRLVHDRFITQSQGPCKNRTATALRPSWYCTASTVASARYPCGLASSLTRSPNSRGSVERKIA